MFSNYSYVSSRYTKIKYYSYTERARNWNYLPIRNVLCEKIYTSKCRNYFCFFQKLSPNYFKFDKKLKVFRNVKRQFDRYFSTNQKKTPPEPPPEPWKELFFATLVLYLGLQLIDSDMFSAQLSWNTFVTELLAKGQVEKIVVQDNYRKIKVIVKEHGELNGSEFTFGKVFNLVVADIENFEEDLREVENQIGIAPSDRVLIVHDYRDSSVFGSFVINILWFITLWVFLRTMKADMIITNTFIKPKYVLIDPLAGQGKGVKFSDVAGLKEAKIEIKEFIDYLKKPEQYKRVGAKIPKGALLSGPPGCGKTLLAKAVATEANVPFLSMNGSEFIELVGGAGAARVRALFSEARRISPCILYIDEIDGIGRKRSSARLRFEGNSEAEQTLNQLLVEMDGVASTEGVVTLASTNRAEVLDKALLRPGRFDRHILIDLPTVEERKEIFVYHLKSKRLEHKPEYYAKRLALLTPGFSGADIGNICNEATLHAARFEKKAVTGEDLDYAIERVIAGAEKISSALSPEEKHLAAYHEAGRALVGWLSEHGDVLLKISVVPRTNLSIGWTQFSPAEQYLFSKEELFDKMCMTLGGRAAESLIFNRVTTKSQKDLVKVTKIAYAQVRQYGMNDLIGPLAFSEDDKYNVKPYSKQLHSLIDEESRKLISRAFVTAESILRENKRKLIKLAEELVKRETMNYDEVVAVIGPPKYSSKKAVEPLAFDMSVIAAAHSESD